MKPTLYLHIGRPKTGSTALQTFLFQNRQPLLKAGICYPETGRFQRASHKLSLLYLPKLPDSHAVDGVNSNELYRQLSTEVSESGASKAVISSEHFWLVDPGSLPASLEEDFDIKVIAYLRRQDEVLVSSFIQEVKSGNLAIDVDLDRYINDSGRLKLLDYETVLDRWSGRFGRDNIQVRLYDELAREHGIETDFLKLLGVAPDSFRFSDIRRNASPSLAVLRLVDELEALDLDRASRRRLIAMLSKASSVLDQSASSDAGSLFTLQQRKRILDRFADSNNRLGRNYLEGTGSPFPALDGDDTTNSESEALAVGSLGQDERVRLLLATSAEQQRQLGLLQNRLQRIEEALGVDGESRLRESRTYLSNSPWAKLRRWITGSRS